MPVEDRVRLDLELAEFVGQFYADALGFVESCFPWPINGESGPDQWQRETLRALSAQVDARRFDGANPVLPIRFGTSSGHGIGKSALSAWIVLWLMSTRPNCRGTVTANTNDQLEKKTWAAIREWHKRCITAHWFTANSQILYRNGRRESWFVSPQSCAEENSEAFAGQHAKDSTSFYIFDEASAIPDKIWEVAEGGLTDGEPMIFAFGNPTRNTGKFHASAFGIGRDRWTIRVIDSRECKFSNKALIAEWQEDYGEDSDFFRVRVRGLPPNADELQFIGHDRVLAAQAAKPYTVAGEPLIAGVDVSGGGSAWTVCWFRRGADARTIPPVLLTGEQTVQNERQLAIAKLAEVLRDDRPDHHVTAMMVDSAFGAPIVVRLRQMGFDNVFEMNFGAPAIDPRYGNARAEWWGTLKDWLPTGSIDPKDIRLAQDLEGPGYHVNRSNKIILEAKMDMAKRGVASPDRGDALALTFSMPVRMASHAQPLPTYLQPVGPLSWMSVLLGAFGLMSMLG